MKIIAHRGASGYKPENTLAAFREAISRGAEMIELDVHVVKSGEVVVIHDSTVDRTTNGSGEVSDFTLEEIRKLNTGHGEKIPLLSEVLDNIDEQVPVNIELKGLHTAKPVARIITHYINAKGWVSSLFIVSSFNQSELAQFMELCPDVRAGILFKGEPGHYPSLTKQASIYSANLDAAAVTKRNVYTAHKKGLKVYVYSVNSTEEARRLESLQVDGIFSDYPDLLSTLANKAPTVSAAMSR